MQAGAGGLAAGPQAAPGWSARRCPRAHAADHVVGGRVHGDRGPCPGRCRTSGTGGRCCGKRAGERLAPMCRTSRNTWVTLVLAICVDDGPADDVARGEFGHRVVVAA